MVHGFGFGFGVQGVEVIPVIIPRKTPESELVLRAAFSMGPVLARALNANAQLKARAEAAGKSAYVDAVFAVVQQEILK